MWIAWKLDHFAAQVILAVYNHAAAMAYNGLQFGMSSPQVLPLKVCGVGHFTT